jgi:hypothetical protein
MWAVGVVMVIGAGLVVALRATPEPDGTATGDEYPLSQPTG